MTPVPIAIGHRFGNSMRGIDAAARAGAAYVECDVWCRDGRLEVRHARTLGPVPLIWDKWYVRPRPARPLTLCDVLASLPEGMGIMVDLKGRDAGLPGLVREALAASAARPVMVSSRFWDHLPSLRAHPELLLFHSVGTVRQLRRVMPLLDLRERDAVSIHYRLLDAEVVRALRERVEMVATWPINDEARLQRVLAWGVGAVITDEAGIIQRLPPAVQV